MASWLTTYGFRLSVFLVIMLNLNRSVLIVAEISNTPVTSDMSIEDYDRTSVKKELRNPDRWTGVGLAEEEEIEPIRGHFLNEGSQILSEFLLSVSTEQLGVKEMQAFYDSLTSGHFEKDDSSKVKELSDKLQGKLSHYSNLVNASRTAIEELYWHHLHRPLNTPALCCELPETMLRYDNNFGTHVSEEIACDISINTINTQNFVPGHNLTDAFSNNLKLSHSIKWQYFLNVNGGLSEYPAHRFDSRSGCGKIPDGLRRRDLYFSTIHPEPRRVVVVIDHGSALSPHQLYIAKAIGKYIISSLSDKDHVGLVALAGETHFAGVGDCFTRGLTRATQHTKLKLNRFIDSLTRAKATANHTLGFKQALDMARLSLLKQSDDSFTDSTTHCVAGNHTCSQLPPSSGDCPQTISSSVLLAYISRGLLSSIAEPRQVLELIALGQLCLQGRLVINTYTLIDDGKPIMYEKAFLQDVATQNYSRYNVSFPALEKLHITRGQALSINSTRWLSSMIGDYLSMFLNSSVSHQAPTFSSARWDPVGKGLVVSLTQPCFHYEILLGTVGLDIHLADLVEDFTYFNLLGGRTYAFLIDTHGTVLMHPSLARPSIITDEPVATDIGLMESRPEFVSIRRLMLSMDSGSEKIILPSLKENADGDEQTTITYTWERVGKSPYIACIVTRHNKENGQILTPRRIPPASPADLVYHRLDVVSSPSKVDMCRYFRQHSTLAAGSLFLSPAAHSSSFQFESLMEPSPVIIQSFMAFLSDKTKLIANPGLRPSVRSDVSILTQLVPFWKSQLTKSPLTPFVVRRFAAAPSGVLIEYPPAVRPGSFDPLRRSWYLRALEFPGKVVVTGPTLDPSGSGYVVSVSHTVFEGRKTGLHNSGENIMAVLGADLTLSYFHRLLYVTLPFCPDRNGQVRGSSIRCFLMDDRGYLLAHPNLLEPPLQGGLGTIEQQHLTHHEPLVASDLLNHDRFVLKKACASYSDRTVQRFYQLNLTASDKWLSSTDAPLPVLTNLVHGEHCIRYQIIAVQGTNLFVGVVNQTCESATAFCPCSTIDRLCLNCHRMEQSECECPCECPLELDTCINVSDSAQSDAEGLPTCPSVPEASTSLPPRPSPRSPDVELLPVCFPIDCESRTSEEECFGIVGCEWCVRESDGISPLQIPFCTQNSKCFGGVLRGPSPYNDDSNNGLPPVDISMKSLPVGPVAGGVMAFFFFVGLSIYCYRHLTKRRGHGSVANLYGGGPGTGMHMTQLDNDMDDNDDMEPDVDDTTAVVNHEFTLSPGAGLDNVAIVSPYRVNTGYRRPAGGDSDHGYSTMTPHEDSEHAASFVEPLLVGRDRYRPSAMRSMSTASFSSRASSPMGPVFHPSSVRGTRRIASPGTLHESADELESDCSGWKPQQQLLADIIPASPVQRLDDTTGMTILPDSSINQLVVPVTVHMVDTT